MIVDPEDQPPEIQTLDINVATLESASMRSLDKFFEDPGNAYKKPVLEELFKLAKIEERYMRKEIGRLPSSTPCRTHFNIL